MAVLERAADEQLIDLPVDQGFERLLQPDHGQSATAILLHQPVYLFRGSFERPSGWTFEAGQAIDITLLAPSETDAEGNARTFTIASAPYEKSLMVATRMRGTAFKRVLKVMPASAAVQIESPTGVLTLHNDAARTAVFLSGGIGITPFRSIAFGAAKEHLPHRILLFYSNRRPEDGAGESQLQAHREHSEMEKSHRSWHGETGVIDKKMLARYLKDAESPIHYIAGPPGMVKGLHMMISESGVDEGDIRTGESSLYTVIAGKFHREYRFPNFGKAFGFMKTAAPLLRRWTITRNGSTPTTVSWST